MSRLTMLLNRTVTRATMYRNLIEYSVRVPAG